MNQEQTIIGASRAEAIELGLVHFKASKPCIRGHSGPRYTLTGNCVECTVQRVILAQAKMRDRIRAIRAQKGAEQAAEQG